jgi:hypothetical protein
MNAAFAEARDLAAALKEKTGGELVGIAVRQGVFAVQSTRRNGRKFVTTQLTKWQSYGECLDFMRKLAA